MPIEIRELTIKVNVNNDSNAAGSSTPAGGGNEDEGDEKVREAVEEVLRIMDSKKER